MGSDDGVVAVAEVLVAGGAAAAAAAYRIGSVVRGAGCGRPAFSILAIGCWAKFGIAGGLPTAQS